MQTGKGCRPAERSIATIMAAAALLTLTACSDQAADGPPGDVVGKPNPAAVFCEAQGGQYLLDTGECRLADGTVRDAWEFYRANAKPGDQTD